MANEQVLLGLASIVVLGVGAQYVADRLRMPSILLLLAVGFIAGATGFLDPDALLGDLLLPFVSLSVGIILFEGGLGLSVRELRGHGRVVTRLVTVGAFITWLLAAGAAAVTLGLRYDIALLVGAILTVTGPTVVGPLLRHVRPRGDVGTVIKWEGILIDPIGALLAVLVFEAVSARSVDVATSTVVAAFGTAVLSGTLVGVLAAIALYALLRYRFVPDHLENAMTLALVLSAFVAADLLQTEAGLLATTVMGVVLANQRGVHVHRIMEFKENLSVLIIAALFVLLAARLDVSDLAGLGGGAALFIATLMLVVRPLAVAVSTVGSRLNWRERLFTAWMAPRGIVAAAVASVFALRLDQAGHPQAASLVPAVFLVIVVTVAFYGLAAFPIARGLGLAGPPAQGALIIGAQRFPRALAEAIRSVGHRVLLVDTNPNNVFEAVQEGLPAVRDNALANPFKEHLDMDGLGRLLAMTPNDEANALAALKYEATFGRGSVFQLPSQPRLESEKSVTEAHEHRGRILFRAEASLAELHERFDAGDRIHSLAMREGMDLEQVLPPSPSGKPALFMFAETEAGFLRFPTVGLPLAPRAGWRVFYLGGALDGQAAAPTNSTSPPSSSETPRASGEA